ncbi:MAG: transposase [Cycloclasticus sp.]|nr:transposase [Cycloclasticus sp.]
MTEGRIKIIDKVNGSASEGALGYAAPPSGSGNGVDGKSKCDLEAGRHVKNDSCGRKKSTYGFSIHTGVDEDGFIHRQQVTPGNVHDSQERDTLILGDESGPVCRCGIQLYRNTRYTRIGGCCRPSAMQRLPE